MELENSFTEMLMELLESILTQLMERNSLLATKKARIGTKSLEPSLQATKNAEQTPAVSIFVPSKKFTLYLALKRLRYQSCCGQM